LLNFLKHFSTTLFVLSAAVFLFVVAKNYQKTPEQIFTDQIIGRWHNISINSKTYIDFYPDNKCLYHDQNKDNQCSFIVKNRVVTVIFKYNDSKPSKLRIVDKEKDSLRNSITLGMELSSISITNNILTGKMKAISGVRETIPREIKLKKENLPEKTK